MPRAKSTQNPNWSRQAAARAAVAALQPEEFQEEPEAKLRVGGGRAEESYDTAVFGTYQKTLGQFSQGSGADAAALERVREHLLSSRAGAAVCLVCLESIGHQDPVWYCGNSCYVLLHLQCAQAWAQQQLATARARREEKTRLFPHQDPDVDIVWACPKCRHEYAPELVPKDYMCFCGKVRDPDFDPWKTPHSCSDICGRELDSGCEHTCVLLCHPGPCPPCPREVDAICFCGKQSARRRCGRSGFSCKELCGKVLPCGHSCSLECHEGSCPPCTLQDNHTCQCGAEIRRVACAEQFWRCDRKCESQLSCGLHFCQHGCHSGPCQPCGLEGLRSCPCGKTTVHGLRCNEPTTTCGETCGKTLSCGIHLCTERCHVGPCPDTCRGMVMKSCGCGKTQKEVPCFADVKCERRCPLPRPCGRHTCKRRCCDGTCPPCPEICGRRLRCGNHKCLAPCHSGDCLPCPLTATISCACGLSRYSVPCGSERRVQPPLCRFPCQLPRLCRHRESIPSHQCHFGPCPPCPFACATPLSCGHVCGSPDCHDAPGPAVPPYEPPPAPKMPGPSGSTSANDTSQAPVHKILASIQKAGEPQITACSGCQHPVEVTCVGGHRTQSVPCSSASEFSCGQPCGAQLDCGNHTCQLLCHGSPGGPSCRQCSEPCARERRLCSHPCPQPCHADPCKACLEPVERPCHCSKTQLRFACKDIAGVEADELKEKLTCGKVCHQQLPDCPHGCPQVCHSGPCSTQSCEETVTVKCPCKRMKAKWSCQQVQAALQTTVGCRSFGPTDQLRLLECSDQCKKQPAKGAQATTSDPSEEYTRPKSCPEAKEPASLEDRPARPLTKEEKQREREEKRLARIAAQEQAEAEKRRRKLLARIIKVLGTIAIVAVGVLLGLLLFQVAAPGDL